MSYEIMKKVSKRGERINKQSSEIDRRYQELISDETSIMEYPLIYNTLDNFRRDEMKLSTNKKRAEMSFTKLLKKDSARF